MSTDLQAALDILEADARRPSARDWRYGVRHSVSVIKTLAAPEPAPAHLHVTAKCVTERPKRPTSTSVVAGSTSSPMKSANPEPAPLDVERLAMLHRRS